MAAHSARRRDKKREVRHLMYGESARESIGKIYKGMEIFGLTKGQFSIINVIEEVLSQTGVADVVISTWTAAGVEIKKAEDFLNNGLINKLHFIVDRSFETRKKKYYDLLISKFGDIVSITNTHAKFILISNDEWKISIRTSMNLNENKRLENFEISDDKELFNYLSEISAEIMDVNYSYFEFKNFGRGKQYEKYRKKEDANDVAFEPIDFG